MSDYSIYPKAIDGYAQIPLAVDRQSPVNAEGVNRLRSGIINIENTLGVAPHASNAYGEFLNVDLRVENLETNQIILTARVDDLEHDNLDEVYHVGRVINADNGPIVINGASYFELNQEDVVLFHMD